MPSHKSAKKRMRQTVKRNEANRSDIGEMRTAIKKVLTLEDKAKGPEVLSATFSVIDKLAKKGLIHKNNAAHKKARIASHVNSL